MAVTLKDLLPGILGLAAGSVSPRAGRAGAMAIDQYQGIQDRNRRQTLEDERMQMSRSSAARAERGEARATQNFEWARADQIWQDNERQRITEERGRARDVGAQIVAENQDMPVDFRNAFLNAESDTEIRQLQGQYTQFVSDTPVDPSQLDAIRESLKPGEYKRVYVRDPQTGAVSAQTLHKPQVSQSGSGMTGFSTLLNAGQGVQSAGLTLEQARGDRDKHIFDEGTKNVESYDAVTDQYAAQKPGGVRVPRIDTTQQDQAIQRGELGLQQAGQDFQVRAAQYPEFLMQVIQLLAGDMTSGVNMSTQPAAADPEAATPGAAGVAYSEMYKQPPQKVPRR